MEHASHKRDFEKAATSTDGTRSRPAAGQLPNPTYETIQGRPESHPSTAIPFGRGVEENLPAAAAIRAAGIRSSVRAEWRACRYHAPHVQLLVSDEIFSRYARVDYQIGNQIKTIRGIWPGHFCWSRLMQ